MDFSSTAITLEENFKSTSHFQIKKLNDFQSHKPLNTPSITPTPKSGETPPYQHFTEQLEE